MPTTCGFPNCRFRSRYRGSEDNRHFYRVPKKPVVLRKRWLEAIGRTEETIVSQLRICSGHFHGGEKHEGDIPVADPAIDQLIRIELPPKTARVNALSCPRSASLYRCMTSTGRRSSGTCRRGGSRVSLMQSTRLRACDVASIHTPPPPTALAGSMTRCKSMHRFKAMGPLHDLSHPIGRPPPWWNDQNINNYKQIHSQHPNSSQIISDAQALNHIGHGKIKNEYNGVPINLKIQHREHDSYFETNWQSACALDSIGKTSFDMVGVNQQGQNNGDWYSVSSDTNKPATTYCGDSVQTYTSEYQSLPWYDLAKLCNLPINKATDFSTLTRLMSTKMGQSHSYAELLANLTETLRCHYHQSIPISRSDSLSTTSEDQRVHIPVDSSTFNVARTTEISRTGSNRSIFKLPEPGTNKRSISDGNTTPCMMNTINCSHHDLEEVDKWSVEECCQPTSTFSSQMQLCSGSPSDLIKADLHSNLLSNFTGKPRLLLLIGVAESSIEAKLLDNIANLRCLTALTLNNVPTQIYNDTTHLVIYDDQIPIKELLQAMPKLEHLFITDIVQMSNRTIILPRDSKLHVIPTELDIDSTADFVVLLLLTSLIGPIHSIDNNLKEVTNRRRPPVIRPMSAPFDRSGAGHILGQNDLVFDDPLNQPSFIKHDDSTSPCLADRQVGIIGLNPISLAVARRLFAFKSRILLFDPSLRDGQAESLGLEHTHSLHDLVTTSSVILLIGSNSKPTDIPVRVPDYDKWRLKQGAIFICLDPTESANGLVSSLLTSISNHNSASAIICRDPEPQLFAGLQSSNITTISQWPPTRLCQSLSELRLRVGRLLQRLFTHPSATSIDLTLNLDQAGAKLSNFNLLSRTKTPSTTHRCEYQHPSPYPNHHRSLNWIKESANQEEGPNCVSKQPMDHCNSLPAKHSKEPYSNFYIKQLVSGTNSDPAQESFASCSDRLNF